MKTLDEPTIKRPSRLGEEVYNAIYAQLMSLKIPPGGRISIDNLSRTLGVSQTPVREALSRLEEQGLVVKTHLVGYSAANQLDARRFGQLYELRMMLEPVAAAKAALNMTPEAIAALSNLANETRPDAAGSHAAYGRFAQRDNAFHDMIAAGSGNELIQECLARLHIHVHLFRLFHHAHAAQSAVDEHDKIVDAILARNSDAAHEAMALHLKQSRERFATAFDHLNND